MVYEHVFVGAARRTDPIFGADFLASEHMTVTFDTNELIWGPRRLNLIVDGADSGRCQVVLNEDTIVACRSTPDDYDRYSHQLRDATRSITRVLCIELNSDLSSRTGNGEIPVQLMSPGG